MGNLAQIVDDAFESEVIKSIKLTIVDFWAAWCGPCKMIAPILEELAGEYADQIKVVKLNVDENPKTPADFGITSIPTLLFYKDGKVIDRVVGALPKAHIVDKIQRYL
ncbi:MAG: thioredoxin [Spirochaetota bacterium]|nr:thioredoxin [Spirochaetota bacterium]